MKIYISLWSENVGDINIIVRKLKELESLLQKPNMDVWKSERLVLEKQDENTRINNFIIIFTH
jgi:hypothetical protein